MDSVYSSTKLMFDENSQELQDQEGVWFETQPKICRLLIRRQNSDELQDLNESHNPQSVHIIKETTTTTTSTTAVNKTDPTIMSSNLSELDSLLEDLNSARYKSQISDKRVTTTQVNANGPSPRQPASPHYKSIPINNGTVPDARPSVESLLDELQSAVPSSPNAHSTVIHSSPSPSLQPGQRMVTTYTITTTTTDSQSQQQPAPTASSATKELDDLMASLSDFKINAGTPVDPTYAKPQKAKSQPQPQPLAQQQPGPSTATHSNQLDSMLGKLQSDMNKHGFKVTAKGHCAACNKPIVGQVVTALGKTWHPEHFTCAHCNQELGTKNFFERDGQPYCEPDYHNLFSPRCAYCNGPILDKCVTALEKTWHPEHFFCTHCGRNFGDEGFHERDSKAFCRICYFEMFAPKCGGCNHPIMDNYISALDKQWHPECFVCSECRAPFGGGSFFDHDGRPYCETHYHAKRGSLCAGCHKPITGRCITAMYKKFHPEHFVCCFCLKQLNKGTFKEQNDKPYCHPCFEKLFG